MAPVRTGRVSAAATTAALHTEHLRHPKRAVHSHPAPMRRFFVSSPAVAMPNQLWASAEAGGALDGIAEDANMDGILGDEELERVFESIGEAEDSRECCSWRPRGGTQDGPSPDLSSSYLIKKTQWLAGPSIPTEGATSRNGSQKRATRIFSWLRKLTCPRTLWLQRRPGCDRKDGGRASRMRSSGRRSTASGSSPSRRRAAR